MNNLRRGTMRERRLYGATQAADLCEHSAHSKEDVFKAGRGVWIHVELKQQMRRRSGVYL